MSEWYYVTGGEQQGPVTAAQLKSLAASGTLKPEDLVWNQTMTEWVPARRVKGLPFAGQPAATKPAAAQSAVATVRRAPAAAPAPEPEPTPAPEPAPAEAFAPTEPAEEVASEPASKSETTRPADEAAPGETAEILGQSRFWVGVMTMLFFIAIALAIAYEVWRILPATKHATTKSLLVQAQTVWGVRQIVRSLAAILMLIPWFSLLRLGSALGGAKSGGSTEDINTAARAQKSFWKSMTVTSILVIVIALGAYVYKMVLHK